MRVVTRLFGKRGNDRIVVVAVIGAFELENFTAPREGARQSHGIGSGFRARGRIGDFLGAECP